MDVDLLRPGTVPISPDTVLWFEFLLDQNLLKRHLDKPNPGRIPIPVIVPILALVIQITLITQKLVTNIFSSYIYFIHMLVSSDI